MIRPTVLTKADMYRRLVAGEFGNTIERWFTVREWEARTTLRSQRLWGVQHATIPGFPGTRLNVETDAVARVIQENGFGTSYVISAMVTEAGAARWEGDVALMEHGLICSGNRTPVPGTWRKHMLSPTLWERSAAVQLLQTVLNENSYDDLMILLENYPGHVVEFTALERCMGTVPGRNAIVWEVRKY